MGFPGPLYPVNPKGGEILSLPAYPSILDIPGPVDYVISSIPAPAVPELIRQCGLKGVKLAHLFTAGFTESGEAERARLELEIRDLARVGGVRILGPNCMGLYCPATGLSWSSGFPQEPGPVAFISQSGANASDFVGTGTVRGLRFSKVISFGNALDLEAADFFGYCAQDPQTQFIGAYLEGVRDGRRFLRALQAAAQRKPVILLKGGRTEAGTRAVASHTASLAGSDLLWDALCRQAGALRVSSIEELVDVMVTFRFLPRPKGRNMVLVGGGGGTSVIAADDCAAAGFAIPTLPTDIQEQLRRYVPIAGTSIRNPLDSGMLMGRPDELVEVMQLIGASPAVDLFLVHMSSGTDGSGRYGPTPRDVARTLVRAAQAAGKPVAVALRSGPTPQAAQAANALWDACLDAGLPIYPSIRQAARAIAAFISYHEAREES